MLHSWLVRDLARQNAKELERAAFHHRLLAELSRDARPAGPGRMRELAARPVRAFSRVTHAVSDAACTAATRLEGRSA